MPANGHKPRLSQLLSEALGLKAAASVALDRARANLNALEEAIQRAVEEGVEWGIKAQPAPTPPPTDHRRAHRPGKPRRLDANAELQAFVLARLDRMTFHEIAAAVANHFPPGRRVAKSAIHDWWKRNAPPGSRR